MLSLAIAAVLLIGAIQCGYSARQYLWSAAEAFNWQPGLKDAQAELEELSKKQAREFSHWSRWSAWVRNLHFLGHPGVAIWLVCCSSAKAGRYRRGVVAALGRHSRGIRGLPW